MAVSLLGHITPMPRPLAAVDISPYTVETVEPPKVEEPEEAQVQGLAVSRKELDELISVAKSVLVDLGGVGKLKVTKQSIREALGDSDKDTATYRVECSDSDDSILLLGQ